jgi:hypothetical protein
MVHRPLFAATVVTAALMSQAACSCDRSPPAPDPVPASAPPLPGAPTPAKNDTFEFVPPESEFTDVAVGESIVREIELRSLREVDWSVPRLYSTCECLSAEYAGAPAGSAVKVRVTVHGTEPETIEGGVGITDRNGEKLVEHLATIAIRRVPFTEPRVIELSPSAGTQFELVLGQAFALDADLPPTILDEIDVDKLDRTKIELVDMQDVPKAPWPVVSPKSWLLATRLVFAVVATDLKAPFDTTIPVRFGVPVVERVITVRWPGTP